MREFVIQLHSVHDVQELVAIVTKCPHTVLVGDRRHRVNGKSFMEMFCLDLAEPLVVAVDCTEAEFEAFRRAAARFLV